MSLDDKTGDTEYFASTDYNQRLEEKAEGEYEQKEIQAEQTKAVAVHEDIDTLIKQKDFNTLYKIAAESLVESDYLNLGLSQRFAERDGMFFLPEQLAEYDKKKMRVKELVQTSLFVSDESSAIAWLRQQLKQKPQTFQDLNPQFMQETSGWSKNEKMLELSTLLEENFLMYSGQGKVPEQIHTYLSINWKDMRKLDKEDPALMEKAKNRWYVPDPNKAGDLEKVREKSLLKEFEIYRQRTKKFTNRDKFRIEAVKAGFKKAWQERDYETIIAIAEKIPNNVLEEDPKLLMWYDQSVTRKGD